MTKNDVIDEMMNDGSTKRKIYDYNYNRSTEIDKQNENKERTKHLQIFPPI